MKCHACGKEFTPIRATAKFCSDNCRKKWSRKIVSHDIPHEISEQITPQGKISETKAEEQNRTKFIPNWKLHGKKDKEEGMIFAIAMIKVKQKELKQAGLSDDLSITWHGRSVML